MKKIFIYLIAILAYSCSLPDENVIASTLLPIPIESVNMPQIFQLGETYEITLNYILPTNCHHLDDIYHQKEGSVRTIAIISEVFPGSNCQTESEVLETSFNFTVSSTSDYLFKFWQGEDTNGNDIYLTMEIPVEQ